MRLKDKVALIGGAGGNMSRACAVLFAQEGAKIVLVARSAERMQETAQRIESAGGQVFTHQANLADESAVDELARAAMDQFGGVDCFVHAAGGFFSSEHKLTRMAPEFLDEALRNNIRTLLVPAQRLVPVIAKRGGGTIITLAAGFRVRQDANSAYAAAKGGMIAAANNLAAELYTQNIRVHAICPGIMWDSLPEGPLRPLKPKLERIGNPLDVAYGALWLCSDEAAWVTGQAVTIDGGDSVFVDSPTRRAALKE